MTSDPSALLPPRVARARKAATPPFEIGDFCLETAEFDRLRAANGIVFATLPVVVITIRLHDDWLFHHHLDFLDGILRSHRGQLTLCDSSPPDLPPEGVHVGLSWTCYRQFRSGMVGIAEACARTGFVRGEFPMLALAEGLVSKPPFLRSHSSGAISNADVD